MASRRHIAYLAAALFAVVGSATAAADSVEPLLPDARCRRFNLVETRSTGVLPERPCGTFELEGRFSGYWTRLDDDRGPRGGAGVAGTLRYRAVFPALVELSTGPDLWLRGNGGLSATVTRFTGALDLRGIRVGLGVARYQLGDPSSTERGVGWALELDGRLGGSDGLAVWVRARYLRSDTGHEALSRGWFLPGAVFQIPLYPAHTLLKHFFRLSFEGGRAGYAEFGVGTAHQLLRREHHAVLLLVGFRIAVHNGGTDSGTWIGRVLSLGLEWRARPRDRVDPRVPPQEPPGPRP